MNAEIAQGRVELYHAPTKKKLPIFLIWGAYSIFPHPTTSTSLSPSPEEQRFLQYY